MLFGKNRTKQEVAQIRLQIGDVPVTEGMEEKIVEYIRETLKRFDAVKYNAEALAMRTTTLKVQEGCELIKLYVKVSTQRVDGVLRIFTFNIEK